MSPPPSDDKSGITTSDNIDGSITSSGSDVNIMEELGQSKTCDAPCCQHSHGCHCARCFCQVRTDIPHNENQTTYGSEGGEHGAEDWNMTESSVLSTDVTDDDVVHPLTTDPGSSDTNDASSPINIGPSSLHPHSRLRPLSLGDLRNRDADQSYEDRANDNIHRYMSSLRSNITVPLRASFPIPEIEHPEKEFNSPASDCDCELMFEFESNEHSRCNSNELPPDVLSSQGHRSSSRNPSVAVRMAGEQFDSTSIAIRTQYNMGLSLCYSPLVLVPEFRRAANCA